MQLTVRDMTLNLSHPQVMGILNVTPDSFPTAAATTP